MDKAQTITDQICLGNSLSGKVLKVSIGELSGATMVFWNASGDAIGYGGYVFEELLWLSISLNFSDFGTLLGNGSWTGMKGQLQRKEVDLVCSSFTGASGSDVLDVAANTRSDVYGMLTRYPEPYSSIYGHITTFSLNVWIGLLLSIIACTGFIKLLAVLNRKYFSYNPEKPIKSFSTLGTIFGYILATLTNHGGYYRDSYRSVGVMAATWSLTTFVFVNIYCSCLTSYTSLTFQRPDINSFRDLANNNPRYLPTSVMGSIAEIILLEARSGPMKVIGDTLKKCPKGICSISNFDKTVQKVLEQDFVALVPLAFGENYIYKTLANQTCRLTMAQDTMTNSNFFMAAQKKSPFAFPLFKESFRYISSGLNNYWVKKSLRGAPQCQLQYNSQGESGKLAELSPLKLEQFYVAFAILFCGYALALIQFLRERFIHCE